MPQPKPPPEHISYSSRDTLLRCAKSYFLSKIAGAPRWPALWSAGGSAVHKVTEVYDLATQNLEKWTATSAEREWDKAFEAELDELRARMDNEQAWRQNKTEPVRVWRALGYQLVQAYIAWRERTSYEIWTTPDGQPAIELDVRGMLPGCPVEIQAYVDRVLWDPVFEQLIILDLKTGKRAPKNAEQFATYKALLEAKYGVKAKLGVPFMNRLGTLGRVYELDEYTPESVGETYGMAWEQIQDHLASGFPADGFDKECFLCDVQTSCFVKNGPLAARYDPASPDYVPF